MQLFLHTLFLLAMSTLARTQRPLSFVLIGDSTTNNGTTLNSSGWSNGFCASLADVSAPHCINTAHNGATTGSTILSGQFNTSLSFIQGEVSQGRRTLVTIQFGHNDMKIVGPAQSHATGAFLAHCQTYYTTGPARVYGGKLDLHGWADPGSRRSAGARD